ncbi:MAG: Rpp14/Pop5 family protein [Candidatus Helarchaeota archaeon]
MKLEKHRFVVFKFYSENTILKDNFIKGIWDSIYKIFGYKGASETGLWIIEFDNVNKKGIIRCSVKSLNYIKIALILTTYIPKDNPVMFQIVGVSGTIKKAKEKFYNEC